ncbi:hypothetical protein BDW69DRAFT_172416 [Aspergillus filifer]
MTLRRYPRADQQQDSLTVGDVITILVENGRHKYEFNEQGTGRRYWITGTSDLLFEKGVLGGQKQVDEVKGTIKILWPERTFLELDRWAYYE